MTGDHRGFLRGQFSFDDVEVGATDAAVGNADQDFAAGGLRSGNVRKQERIGFNRSRRFEEAGFHGGTPYPPVFAKRGCKPLKTNNTMSKKRGKRLKERAKRRQSAGNKRLEENRKVRSGESEADSFARAGSCRGANMGNDSIGPKITEA